MSLVDLAKPFAPNQVQWRAQTVTKDGTKAMALAYIDARTVMDRLDAVVGPEGWQCEYAFDPSGKKALCRLGVRVQETCGVEWIWKADGAGDSDVEAEKGALSDAFKRAAVKWGIGRYLYDMPAQWVPCESRDYNGKKQFVKFTVDPSRNLLRTQFGDDLDAPQGSTRPGDDSRGTRARESAPPRRQAQQGGSAAVPASSSNIQKQPVNRPASPVNESAFSCPGCYAPSGRPHAKGCTGKAQDTGGAAQSRESQVPPDWDEGNEHVPNPRGRFFALWQEMALPDNAGYQRFILRQILVKIKQWPSGEPLTSRSDVTPSQYTVVNSGLSSYFAMLKRKGQNPMDEWHEAAPTAKDEAIA